PTLVWSNNRGFLRPSQPKDPTLVKSYNKDSPRPSQLKDPTLVRSYNRGSLQQGFPQLSQLKDPTLVRSYNRGSLQHGFPTTGVPSTFSTQRPHPGEVQQQRFPTTGVPLNPLPSTSYNGDSPRPSQLRDPTIMRSYNRGSLNLLNSKNPLWGSLQQGFPTAGVPSTFSTQRPHSGEILRQRFPQPSQLKNPTIMRSYNRGSLDLINSKTPLW
ncbi:hypothetical protein Y032_0378g276, partial [Ancylostoma ceylanicum]